MKKTIFIILFLIIFSIGCSENKPTTSEKPVKPKVVEVKPEVKKEVKKEVEEKKEAPKPEIKKKTRKIIGYRDVFVRKYKDKGGNTITEYKVVPRYAE